MTEPSRSARQKEKEETWTSHVEALKLSGLSQIDYCREHNLSRHRFTYWKCKLYRKTSPVKFIPISGGTVRSRIGYNNSTPIKLNIGSYQIEVGDGFSPETLTNLISTLGPL